MSQITPLLDSRYLRAEHAEGKAVHQFLVFIAVLVISLFFMRICP